MRLRVDSDRALSPSGQIVETVLDAVAAGELGPAARLPSVREAAAEALVNPNTVARAWRDLEALGVVEGRAGSGVFVTAGGPEIARRERRRATLDALRQAAEQAARSGHESGPILEEVRRALARAAREASRDASDGNGGRR
jgi:GntR family transcriptional regulator